MGAVLAVMQLLPRQKKLKFLMIPIAKMEYQKCDQLAVGVEASLLYLLERSQSVPVEEEVVEGVRLPSPPPCALFQHVEEEVVTAHPRMGFCLASFCAFQVYLQGSHENEEPGELVHLKLVSSLATAVVSPENDSFRHHLLL